MAKKREQNKTPLTGPFFYGTHEQRRAMERWQNAGYTLLHWTEVPGIMAVLEGFLGEIVFVDDNGIAWKGPRFNKANPVPLEKYPPLPDHYD